MKTNYAHSESYQNYQDKWVGDTLTQTEKALQNINHTFTIEELRKQVVTTTPIDNRWWGQITTMLKKSGKIRRVNNTGRPAESSNYSLKPVWERAS